jgi:glutaredoxin-related protein
MDPRDQKPKFDLDKIDFEWVASTESAKELKKALKALQDDKGGYVELEKAIEEKILLLDPSS